VRPASSLSAVRPQMETGLVAMLRDEKVSDIARMYRLLGPVSGGIAAMRQCLGDYLYAVGMDAVVKVSEALGSCFAIDLLSPPQDQEKAQQPIPFVETLLDLKVVQLLRPHHVVDRAFFRRQRQTACLKVPS